jgi:ubiquinone/menaquinone biosynthesis C-methylase UbiE
MFNNATNLCFSTGSFDIALCGFMGWSDCFDFVGFKYIQPDSKAQEIQRVLREGGKFLCCAWEAQEDLVWMEAAMLRYYPALLQDGEYQQQRPIGAAYEKAQGYEIILRTAGFQDIEIYRETAEFVSTDEEEFWRAMQNVGWEPFFEKINKFGAEKLQRIKDAIFKDLQFFKQSDGIHFTKTALYASGVK